MCYLLPFTIIELYTQVVDKTIIMADTNGDGQISYEEFAAMVGTLSFHRRMIVTV